MYAKIEMVEGIKTGKLVIFLEHLMSCILKARP